MGCLGCSAQLGPSRDDSALNVDMAPAETIKRLRVLPIATLMTVISSVLYSTAPDLLRPLKTSNLRMGRSRSMTFSMWKPGKLVDAIETTKTSSRQPPQKALVSKPMEMSAMSSQSFLEPVANSSASNTTPAPSGSPLPSTTILQ